MPSSQDLPPPRRRARPSRSTAFTKTDSDVDGTLVFVRKSPQLCTPQDILFIGYGTIHGEERKIFALPWVGQSAGCVRTRWYYLDEQAKHRMTNYDVVQKWLPGFWTAQVTNTRFPPKKTRIERVLSIFFSVETLEQAMSTVFDITAGHLVTDKEITLARWIDDENPASEGREAVEDEGETNDLFESSQAEYDSPSDSIQAEHDSPFVVSQVEHEDDAEHTDPHETSPADEDILGLAIKAAEARAQSLANQTEREVPLLPVPGRRPRREKSESSMIFPVAPQHKRLRAHGASSTASRSRSMASSTSLAHESTTGGRSSRRVKRPSQKLLDGRVENLAKDWRVDITWLSTNFGTEFLQQSYFLTALENWINAHPTMPAQDALAHFHRRRELRRSGKLSMRRGRTPSHAWTAADIQMEEDEDEDEDDDDSASRTAPAASGGLSITLRPATSANRIASTPGPMSMPSPAASVRSKMAASSTATSPVSTIPDAKMTTASPQPTQLRNAASTSFHDNNTVSPQPTQMRDTPSTFSQHNTTSPQPEGLRSTPAMSLPHNIAAQTTPSVEPPMTEDEAVGILYGPMTSSGPAQCMRVQRAIGAILGKTPPLEIVQAAVFRLRHSKDPEQHIDDDKSLKAWLQANV